MVVLAIAIVLMGVLIPSLASFFMLDQRQAAKDLTTLYQQLHDEAVMRNVTFRVAYNLRHSAITDLIALHRLDTMTVAQLSGTSLAMIEKHYGHLLRDHAADALSKLALG